MIDAGSPYFLARLPYSLGKYMGLFGGTLRGIKICSIHRYNINSYYNNNNTTNNNNNNNDNNNNNNNNACIV